MIQFTISKAFSKLRQMLAGLGAGAGDCDRLGRPADELPHAPFMAGE